MPLGAYRLFSLAAELRDVSVRVFSALLVSEAIGETSTGFRHTASRAMKF
jgi:hypothetical protein